MKAQLEWLAELQEALGVWHDQQVLHEAVAEALSQAEMLLNELQAARILLAELETDRSRKSEDVEKIFRLAIEHSGDGRLLLVNTTELDVGQPRVFDMVAEAQRATDSAELDRVHNIMLASAGIPGAFPFRMIDGLLYVDGAVTGNIIYGGRIAEEDSLPALWQEAYPNHPSPKFRFWVIFNNQFRPVPKQVAPNWLTVIQRSLETSTRAATATAMRHLLAMAEISRLKRKADVEVRIVSIPGDWFPPVPAPFDKETMNNLADLGERMGADPASWSSEPREPSTAQRVSYAGTKPS